MKAFYDPVEMYEKGGEYRFSAEGEHPVPALRDSGTGEDTAYAEAERMHMEPAQ